MNATDIATKAAELIGGDRAEQHGDKHKTFARIAAYWTVYLQNRPNPEAPISAVDVGFMMADLKKARAQAGLFNIDDFVDHIGYIACAGEIATRETKR
ncbi:DUF6378 domain-containing protein [Bradyrhizobium sp. Leo121]|uniref:DUF6378 domain-containing protein n=1 Tax=Bradyrhizobium sp. Leo121 TaxID=1571195 RepID=UPI001029D819|nr:DUF6378 domain-containing protein [Bradyrhizobium sp. Leo121]RZN21948.1 hypothetical protein CWO90_32555 [Bradyrhizobium sp. Leo121]